MKLSQARFLAWKISGSAIDWVAVTQQQYLRIRLIRIMKKLDGKLGLELSVFVGLLLLALASRFWLADIPNFKPVAGCALLSGFFFSRIWLAVGLPVLVMLISDGQLGAYELPIMLAVYGSLAACPLLGWASRRWVTKRQWGRTGQAGSIFASSIVMSVMFFLATNLAVWTQWYELTWSGFLMCFASALPFFKYTLLSNVIFSVGGLCGYWFAMDLAARLRPASPSLPSTIEGH